MAHFNVGKEFKTVQEVDGGGSGALQPGAGAVREGQQQQVGAGVEVPGDEEREAVLRPVPAHAQGGEAPGSQAPGRAPERVNPGAPEPDEQKPAAVRIESLESAFKFLIRRLYLYIISPLFCNVEVVWL